MFYFAWVYSLLLGILLFYVCRDDVIILSLVSSGGILSSLDLFEIIFKHGDSEHDGTTIC